MNKSGQNIDLEELLKFVFAAIIIIPFLGAMFSLLSSLNQQNCPTCDCSQYQNGLTQCQQLVSNLTSQINNTPAYIQNVTYVEVPVEKIIYREKVVPMSLSILAFIFSLTITFRLFKIKLPQEIEEKLKRIEKTIAFVKIGSLAVTIIIFMRLIFLLFSLF